MHKGQSPILRRGIGDSRPTVRPAAACFRPAEISFGPPGGGKSTVALRPAPLPLKAMIWPRPYIACSTNMPWRKASGGNGAAGSPPLAIAAAVVNDIGRGARRGGEAETSSSTAYFGAVSS